MISCTDTEMTDCGCVSKWLRTSCIHCGKTWILVRSKFAFAGPRIDFFTPSWYCCCLRGLKQPHESHELSRCCSPASAWWVVWVVFGVSLRQEHGCTFLISDWRISSVESCAIKQCKGRLHRFHCVRSRSCCAKQTCTVCSKTYQGCKMVQGFKLATVSTLRT